MELWSQAEYALHYEEERDQKKEMQAESHLYPRRHVANLGMMQDRELCDFADILLRVIRGYNALFDGAMAPMPYLLGIHQLADEQFHLHVEIQAIGRASGKLKYAASSESLWGLWTNDSQPPQKAQELCEAIEIAQTLWGYMYLS